MMIDRSFISFRPMPWRNRRRLRRRQRRGRPVSWRKMTGTAVTGTVAVAGGTVGIGRTVDRRRRRCCRTTTSAAAVVVGKRTAKPSTGWRSGRRRPSSGRCRERRRTARRIDYRSTTGRRPDMASKNRRCMVGPSTVGQSTVEQSMGKPSMGLGRRHRSTVVPSTG